MKEREIELMEKMLKIEQEVLIDEEKHSDADIVTKLVKEIEKTYDI